MPPEEEDNDSKHKEGNQFASNPSLVWNFHRHEQSFEYILQFFKLVLPIWGPFTYMD